MVVASKGRAGAAVLSPLSPYEPDPSVPPPEFEEYETGKKVRAGRGADRAEQVKRSMLRSDTTADDRDAEPQVTSGGSRQTSGGAPDPALCLACGCQAIPPDFCSQCVRGPFCRYCLTLRHEPTHEHSLLRRLARLFGMHRCAACSPLPSNWRP